MGDCKTTQHSCLINFTQETEFLEFRNYFETVAKDILKDSERILTSSIVWFKNVLEYNVPHGKLQRGYLTVKASKVFSSNSNQTFGQNEKTLSFILGWCVEILQACCLVADDIMDGSSLRRGRPCWYLLPQVRSNAINDVLFLENAVYLLLKKYFGSFHFYGQLLETFHEITLKTVYGQNMDLLISSGENKNFESYTLENYRKIVQHKTTFYTFCLPIKLAKVLNGSETLGLEKILDELGYYFQVQDDFIDIYGDSRVTKKGQGADISEGKCTWLFITALNSSKLTYQQKQILLSNYGRGKPKNISAVKKVFDEVEIPEIYTKFETENLGRLETLIESCIDRNVQQLMRDLVNQVSSLYRK